LNPGRSEHFRIHLEAMFRDTFAVELLLSGVPIDQVSLLLGYSRIKVREKHYAPFVKARQEQLENNVKPSVQSAR
jgi:integrase/recombinase XerD